MEEKKWYVRNTAGKVFGPIDFESLKSWVKDGRVEPLAGVSCDLTNWVIAPLKPELEMNWVVENNPGQFYGPTHRAVVDDLVKTGTLSPAARFYQDDRGAALERIRGLEVALAAKESEIVQKDSSLAEAQKLSGKKDLQLAAGQKALRERDDRLSEAKSQLMLKDTQIAELTKTVQQRDGQLQKAAAEIARRDAERQAQDMEIARRDAEIGDRHAERATSQARRSARARMEDGGGRAGSRCERVASARSPPGLYGVSVRRRRVAGCSRRT